jgi:hypothetical protein
VDADENRIALSVVLFAGVLDSDLEIEKAIAYPSGPRRNPSQKPFAPRPHWRKRPWPIMAQVAAQQSEPMR